jgi:hypothetical protein
MTPKEAYEARRAERLKIRDMDKALLDRHAHMMALDCLDRIATAFERIADVMEHPR